MEHLEVVLHFLQFIYQRMRHTQELSLDKRYRVVTKVSTLRLVIVQVDVRPVPSESLMQLKKLHLVRTVLLEPIMKMELHVLIAR